MSAGIAATSPAFMVTRARGAPVLRGVWALTANSARISARPDLRRGPSVNFCEHRVKASETAESCENSYFRHRLVGLIDEPLRSLNARRPCYRAGTSLQMPSEQAS